MGDVESHYFNSECSAEAGRIFIQAFSGSILNFKLSPAFHTAVKKLKPQFCFTFFTHNFHKEGKLGLILKEWPVFIVGTQSEC